MRCKIYKSVFLKETAGSVQGQMGQELRKWFFYLNFLTQSENDPAQGQVKEISQRENGNRIMSGETLPQQKK